MLKDVRKRQIYSILKQKKIVTVQQLTQECYSSQATVRRDLEELKRMGLIRRIRGGAELLEGTGAEPAQAVREQENTEKKSIIAQLAIDFVGNNQSVFFDSSTTNRYLIPLLRKHAGMTYITNSFKSAQSLAGATEADVYLSGGRVVRSTNSLSGNLTCAFVTRWHADLAFVACRGASSIYGATVVDPDQADVKRLMIQNAKQVILLCDSTKFEKSFLCKFTDYSDITAFICDQRPPDSLLHAIEARGCEVIFPQESPVG